MGPTIEVTGYQCYRNPETPRSTSPVSSLSMIGIVWTLTPFTRHRSVSTWRHSLSQHRSVSTWMYTLSQHRSVSTWTRILSQHRSVSTGTYTLSQHRSVSTQAPKCQYTDTLSQHRSVSTGMQQPAHPNHI